MSADVRTWLERLRGHGRSQVCTLEPADCRELAEVMAKLLAQVECLRWLASTGEDDHPFLPLHWRGAVERGDIAACAEFQKQSRELVKAWQGGFYERDSLKARVAALRELLYEVTCWNNGLTKRPPAQMFAAIAAAYRAANPADGYTLVADETLRRVHVLLADVAAQVVSCEQPCRCWSCRARALLPEVKP